MRDHGLSWKEVIGIPCLINGDDILFQSDLPSSDTWMGLVGSLGLEVERTKTSVDDEYGSLNSTLLRFVGGHLQVIPTLRFGRLRESEFVNSLGSEFSSFVRGTTNGQRFRAGLIWFRSKLRLLRSTRLTLHEIGFRGTLALRLGRLFKLSVFHPDVVVAPEPPTGHNVVLDREEFTRVPEDQVTEEFRRMASLETVSWKFTKNYQESRWRHGIRYCMAMSSIRRREPLCGPVFTRDARASQWAGRRLGETGRGKQESDAFRQPRKVGVREFAVPDLLLGDQWMIGRECELPPTYEESCGLASQAFDDVVGPPKGGVTPEKK